MSFQADAVQNDAFVFGGAAGAAPDPGFTVDTPVPTASIMESVLGYARLGATRLGDYGGDIGRELMVLIGGVDVRLQENGGNNLRRHVWREPGQGSVQVTDQQVTEGTKSASFNFFNYQEYGIDRIPYFRPESGQEIVIASGTLGNRLFGGEIVEAKLQAMQTGEILNLYAITCGGYRRKFDAKLVFERYNGVAADLIVRDIMAKYVTGFSAVNVQSDAPSIPESIFSGEYPFACCKQVADYIGWNFYLDDWKDAHLEDPKTRYAPQIVPTRYTYDQFTWGENITQNRTRVLVRCGGGSTTQDYAASTAGSLGYIVDSVTWYKSGQRAIVGEFRTNITAVNTGTKTVTLAPPIPYATAQGTKINVLVQRDDLAAQARIAKKTNTDGIFEHFIEDERLSEDGGITIADANLVRFSKENQSGEYSTWLQPRAGDRLPVTYPSKKVFGEFVIQAVTSVVKLAPDYIQSTVSYSDTMYLRFMDLLRAQARKRKDKK